MTDDIQPRPDPQPPAQGGFDMNQPTIVSLLYISSFVVGVTGLVGIVLAHIWDSDTPQGWEKSHFTYHIRTFWIGLLGFIVSGILTLVLIGIPLMIAVAAWVLIRSIVALLRAQKQEPMPDPETFGF